MVSTPSRLRHSSTIRAPGSFTVGFSSSVAALRGEFY
jgi:hypothetical protein